MTSEEMRQLALALPGAQEQDHRGHPSFRVNGKIFATLWPDQQRAVLKLPRGDQEAMTTLNPATYAVAPWGHQGWTYVELATVDTDEFAALLENAWRQVAPKVKPSSRHDDRTAG